MKRGINRNIVECKCFFQILLQNQFLELIETLWNVNNRTISLLLLRTQN